MTNFVASYQHKVSLIPNNFVIYQITHLNMTTNNQIREMLRRLSKQNFSWTLCHLMFLTQYNTGTKIIQKTWGNGESHFLVLSISQQTKQRPRTFLLFVGISKATCSSRLSLDNEITSRFCVFKHYTFRSIAK